MTTRRFWTACAVLVAAAVLLLASACGDDEGPGGEATRTPAPGASPTAGIVGDTITSICGSASPGEVLGSVESPELVEISGLVASRADPDVLWVHNDSGGSPRVYAMGRTGAHLGAFDLAGADAIDWEDIALGPGPEEGQDYLYVGDIGDNDRVRPEITVYRLPEPDVAADAGEPAAGSVEAEKLTLTYPDEPHDAETLLVDPVNGDLFIVTKELETGRSFVLRASGELEDGAAATLERVAEIDFTQLTSEREIPEDAPPLVAGVGHLPTGGDVSPDGGAIAIRTYATVWLWSRRSGSQLWEAFSAAPCEGPSAIEPQGEALSFDSDGLGYFTVSEGNNPPVHFFQGPPAR